LKQHVEDSYTPTPIVCPLKGIFDIREWVGDSKLTGHSKPLCFQFVMGMEGVVMKYRDRSTDPWQCLQGEDTVLNVRIIFLDNISFLKFT
jgi:hypothetical protein